MSKRIDITNCDAPLETEQERQFEQNKLQQRYGHLFKNQEQFNFFTMLPLSNNEQRDALIKRVQEIEEEQEDFNSKPLETISEQ